MTTVCAVRKGDQIVIASDTISTAGYEMIRPDNRINSPKIIPFSDGYLGISGPSVFMQIFHSHVRRNPNVPKFGHADDIFEYFVTFHDVLKDTYHVKPDHDNENAFESSQFRALYVSPAGMFIIYGNRTVYQYDKHAAIGSGSRYCQGALHALYERLEDPKEIATSAISAGIYFDTDTDGDIEVFEVKRSDGQAVLESQTN